MFCMNALVNIQTTYLRLVMRNLRLNIEINQVGDEMFVYYKRIWYILVRRLALEIIGDFSLEFNFSGEE